MTTSLPEAWYYGRDRVDEFEPSVCAVLYARDAAEHNQRLIAALDALDAIVEDARAKGYANPFRGHGWDDLSAIVEDYKMSFRPAHEVAEENQRIHDGEEL